MMWSRQAYLAAIRRHAEAFGERLTVNEEAALEKMKRPELAKELRHLQARARLQRIRVY